MKIILFFAHICLIDDYLIKRKSSLKVHGGFSVNTVPVNFSNNSRIVCEIVHVEKTV